MIASIKIDNLEFVKFFAFFNGTLKEYELSKSFISNKVLQISVKGSVEDIKNINFN